MALPDTGLHLGVAEAAAVPGDVTQNTRRAVIATHRAGRRGVRLLLLPELHLTAYDLTRITPVDADEHGTVHDARLAPLHDAAAEHGLTVLLGAAVRHPDGHLSNALLSIDDTGTRHVYTKQHCWPGEHATFTTGTTSTLLNIDGWQIGLGICYDLSFPEHARTAAVSGAHLYLTAGAFAAGAEHRAAIYLAARALENTIYTAFTNPVGGPAHRPCRGGAGIWAPNGRRLGTAHDGMLTRNLDPTEIRRMRELLPMLTDIAPARGRHGKSEPATCN